MGKYWKLYIQMLLSFKIKILFFCIIAPFLSKGQSNGKIEINIATELKKINFRVFLFYGSKPIPFDSIATNQKTIYIPEGYVGFIRIANEKNNYHDFIVDHESFSINIFQDTAKNWHAISNGSLQNNLLSALKNAFLSYQQKTKQIQLDSDKIALKRNLDKFTDSILSLKPQSFFSRSTKLALLQFEDPNSYTIIDSIPLFDVELINCSVIPGMLMKAFASIGSPDEIKLKEIIRYLMERPMDPQVKEMISTTIIDFFATTNSDHIVQFFSDNFLNTDQCNENINPNSKIKLERALLFRPGNQLPDVAINGVLLSKIIRKVKKNKILIVIWSQDCPHCIDEIFNKKTILSDDIYRIGIEVSGKKIDLKPIKFDINITENSGWSAPIISIYKINKTPSYIYIDNNRRVLSNPENIL